MSDKNDDYELRIGLLRKDLEAVADHTTRLDHAIAQVTKLGESMAKMIAIHEEKHIQHEREEERLIELMTKQQEETKKELEDLEKKMDANQETLHKRISSSEDKVINKIEEAMEKKSDKENTDKVEGRVSRLEKIVWMGLGGLAILQFVIPVAIKIFMG